MKSSFQTIFTALLLLVFMPGVFLFGVQPVNSQPQDQPRDQAQTQLKDTQEMIIKEKFDLVLLDITMPNFSGFDVITSLQDSDNLKKNNIIFFTAADVSDSEIEKWIEFGVKGCLKKPIDPAALFEKIHEVGLSSWVLIFQIMMIPS